MMHGIVLAAIGGVGIKAVFIGLRTKGQVFEVHSLDRITVFRNPGDDADGGFAVGGIVVVRRTVGHVIIQDVANLRR